MNSPISCADWRIFAYMIPTVHNAFALPRESVNLFLAAEPSSKTSSRDCQNRYPSPSLRPDPSRVWPLFFCNRGANRRRSAGANAPLSDNFDRIRRFADNCHTTKRIRGGASCEFSRLRRSSPLSRHLRAVWTPMSNARLPARRPVPSSLTRSTATSSSAQQWAARAVRSATTSTSANPAADLTAGRAPGLKHEDRTIGAFRFGGLFRFDRLKGTTCSRRS